MEKRLLIGIDESDYYKNIVHYLAGLFAAQSDIKLELVTVVPSHGGQAGRELLDEQELLTMLEPAARKRFSEQKKHLLQAELAFIAAGIGKERLTTDIHLARASVVGDLLFKARQGMYDAVVIGKRDLGALEKMISGCYSAEILKQCHEIPLWVVNGRGRAKAFFVPVDCSPHTLNAVDHLGFVLKNNPSAEIVLFHSAAMLANEEVVPREQFYGKWGKEWCDEHLAGEESEGGHFHFHAPEQLLREAGFPMERVRRLKSEKGIEPAQMIVHHVKKSNYGTIVMGRRGKEVSKGIFRGVSDRVLANVENIAVWIIG